MTLPIEQMNLVSDTKGYDGDCDSLLIGSADQPIHYGIMRPEVVVLRLFIDLSPFRVRER